MARDTEEVRIAGVTPEGLPRVEYKRVEHAESHTEAEYRPLPSSFAAFCPAESVALSDLSPDVRAMVEEEVGA